jgi:hypothetical protein
LETADILAWPEMAAGHCLFRARQFYAPLPVKKQQVDFVQINVEFHSIIFLCLNGINKYLWLTFISDK